MFLPNTFDGPVTATEEFLSSICTIHLAPASEPEAEPEPDTDQNTPGTEDLNPENPDTGTPGDEQDNSSDESNPQNPSTNPIGNTP